MTRSLFFSDNGLGKIEPKKIIETEVKTLEWDIINSEITSLNSCGEQAIFKLDINYSTGYLDISF